MILSRGIIITHLLFLFFTTAFSQHSDSLKLKIDTIINQAIQAQAFPGCVIYAAQKDSVFFLKSYGYHTYDSLRPVDINDIYDLASITKVTGATLAVMKLYEEELFNLDDPIGDYIPGLGAKVGKANFRECLAHQAGLYPWIPYYQAVQRKNGTYKPNTVGPPSVSFNYPLSDSLYLHQDFYKKIKKMIRKSKVSKEHKYKYSGLFYYLIPELVNRLTGDSYDNYLYKHFFDSIGAETVVFNPLEKFNIDSIVPTENDTYFRMEQIHGTVHDEGAITMKGISGNAGLFGNASDLAKVWWMFLNEGMYNGKQYLKPETLSLFTTTQFPNNENRRGLGFDKPLLQYDSIKSSVAKSASYRSYGHSGFTGTLAWADPENDLLFIFLTNRVYPSREYREIYNLNVRPNIHQLFYDFLDLQGTKKMALIKEDH